jgi:tetrapyrrole methylase family protein/MazG family protein
MANATITVVGLGPGDHRWLNTATLEAIDAHQHRYVRTLRHPCADVVAGTSFDDLYEAAESFEGVYSAIVDRLVAMSRRYGAVLYAVPGSPLVAEHTVELLLERAAADDDLHVEIVPAMSFVDLTWVRLGVDPLAHGVSIVDGHRYSAEAAGRRAPMLICQCDTQQVLSDIKLSIDTDLAPYNGEEPKVVILQGLGTADELIREVSWNELDRSFEPDHLTSVYIPALAPGVGQEFELLDEVTHTLRRECPWDREQDLHTLTKYLLEETYEVIEAIESGDPTLHVDELGDLLFQIYFQATIAQENGDFSLADVARAVRTKLIRRHPHVYPPADGQGLTAETADDVRRNWEAIKAGESGSSSVMAKVSGAIPALLYAHKVQSKASSVGFDWDDVQGPLADLADEIEELKVEINAHDRDKMRDELGDVLFSVVNVARRLEVDPESALRGAASRFRDRFMLVEQYAAADGVVLADLDVDALDVLWERAKAALKAH